MIIEVAVVKLEEVSKKLVAGVTDAESRIRELEEEVDRLQQQITRINNRLQVEDDRRRRATEMSMRNVT